ncbi:MAG: hypothetical protein C0594_16155 [Marinilabiliales bacterium]|nr:MAG: hypothetical protein C0594_16155 [Marinilabiliales bacterium]
MKREEKLMIEELIDDLKNRFPGIKYKYAYEDYVNLHKIQIDSSFKVDKEKFADFYFDWLDKYEKRYSNSLLITNKKPLVDIKKPNKFSVVSETVKAVELLNESKNKKDIKPESIILAA